MTTALTPDTTARDAAPFQMRAMMVPLIAIIIGIFMVVLDGTAVNVALPRLVADFHTTLPTLQWIVTGYTLAQAAVIPLAGWLSDRFGAKPVFLTSVTLFALGSVLCAIAHGSAMLIAFRVVQGGGGGCVLPIGLAYVYRFAPPAKVGVVMGVMSVPILLAPAIGPVLAGWLVQYASWRWIFLLNLPVGIVGLLVGVIGLPAVRRQATGALDRLGVVLGPLAFAALSYGVSQGSTSWTSTSAIAGLAVGALALVAFIAVELRARNPLLEVRVFASLDFSLAVVAQWVGQIALVGVLFLAPLFLQEVRGFGAFETGLALLPNALAAALVMPLGGVLFDRVGARPLVIVGLGLMAVAMYLLSQVSVRTQASDLIAPLALNGAGLGLMLPQMNTQIFNAAPRVLVSRVTALASALQQAISGLTIAALATILTARATSHLASATAAARGSAPVPGTLARLHHALVTGAMALSFDDAFHLMVVAAIVGAVMGVLLRRNRAAHAATAPEAPARPQHARPAAPLPSLVSRGRPCPRQEGENRERRNHDAAAPRVSASAAVRAWSRSASARCRRRCAVWLVALNVSSEERALALPEET